MTTIQTHRFPNSLTLATESNGSVASAAVSLRLPLGSARDPEGRVGEAAILEELLLRGSESLPSREQSDAFDALGVSRSTSTTTFHTVVGASALGDRLEEALPLIADMVRRPRLGDDGFAASRELCLLSARAVSENPQELVMLKLRERHAPTPLNRPQIGTVEGLEACTAESTRQHYAENALPEGAILAVAGKIDHDRVVEQIGALFGEWDGRASEPTWNPADAERGYVHTQQETNQTHVAVAYDGPAERDNDAVLERLATAVLSGGMSGRLFTEVREKRGLCYAVHASFTTTRDYGRTVAYVGTTPERAQESLDVLTDELRKLGSGAAKVTPEEFRRAKTGLKSRLVMSGESTRARAGALASDVYRLGEPRSLDQIAAAIDAVSLDQLNEYLERRGLGELTIATVGPAELNV